MSPAPAMRVDADRLDAVLAHGVARGAAPGVVAVAVDRDGVLYEGAAGEQTLGAGDAMTVDTVCALFSMTKAVTGIAAMQLVERGVLDLDAPASDVCPELADREVLTGFVGDEPQTRPAASVPTLRQFLTHTSGFAYDLFNADVVRWHEVTGTAGPTANARSMLDAPLVADPGTRWEYGIDLDWVGAMIEAVTGQRLGDHLEEHVLGPLGMSETGYVPSGDAVGRLATVHARLPDGSLMPFPLPLPTDEAHQGGGAGLYGTAGDYARLVRMMLGDGSVDEERLLEPATVELMATNQMGELRVTPMVSALPHLTNDAEFFPGLAKSWGLSFQINEEAAPTGRAAGTLMWAGLANSVYWIDRTSGVGGVVLVQVLPFADAGALELWTDVESAVYGRR